MKKLTSNGLKRIIQQEAAKFGKERDVKKVAKDTKEVGPDDYADTLEKKIDYCAALKIEEGRTLNKLRKIREQRKRLLSSIKKGK